MSYLNILRLNCTVIIKETVFIASGIFTLLSIFLSFVSWNEIGINQTCSKFFIFIGIIIISVLLAILNSCFFTNENVIWKNGTGKIIVRYGDIMKIASKKDDDKKIIVIPVNTCFDTIVDSDIALWEKPIVSPNTIHGKWINHIINSGISQSEIDEKIQKYIRENNIIPSKELSIEQKARGNRLCYKRGTVIPFSNEENVIFFLLVLSEFDFNNNAQCNKDELIDCIKSLISFYDKRGQGFKMYLPLMGTNLSRVGLSHKDALNKITTLFKLYNDQIHGEVNIVVYDKDKDKVSILDV